jgi:hypothetical protein
MIPIQRWVDAFFSLVERLKGEKTVREMHSPGDYLVHLTGYSVSGYEIRLYCQKKIYIREYWRWFIPNEYYVTFRVFSVVSNDAPSTLKNACELELDLPAMMPKFLSHEVQKECAIQAYLDILIAKIRHDQTAAA